MTKRKLFLNLNDCDDIDMSGCASLPCPKLCGNVVTDTTNSLLAFNTSPPDLDTQHGEHLFQCQICAGGIPDVSMAIVWTDYGQNGLDALQSVWMWTNLSSRYGFLEALTLTRFLISCSLDKEKKKWRS